MFLLYSQIPLIFIKVLNISLFYYFLKIINENNLIKYKKRYYLKPYLIANFRYNFADFPYLLYFILLLTKAF